VRRELPDGFELDDDPIRIDIDAVHRFLSQEAYWALGRSLEDVARSVRDASRVVGLYHDGCQIGFTRTIDLGSGVGLPPTVFLFDVYVLPEYRGRGLGVELVRESVERGPYADHAWLLRTEDAHALYRKFGFDDPDERWMVRPARDS
jgi:GNAT superfamily N-acetyltransferase